MKELTIEQKAQRYNEAIKRAKKVHKYSSDPAEIKRIEQIFPELIESEDENIRKSLINYFSDFHLQTFVGLSPKKILAWLEKQGEQKPIDKIQLGKIYKCIASPRYSTFMIGEIYKPKDKFLCSLMNFCSDCFEPIEDGEQKPDDKVEPKFKVGDWITIKE